MRRTDFFGFALAFIVIFWGIVQSRGQDASGFTEQLNVVRAKVGLSTVYVDANAVGVSARNNAQQRAQGLGHWFTGGLAQCAAVGAGDTARTLAMWLNSPAHRAIILSPALIAVGYHNDGYAATVACSMNYSIPAGGIADAGMTRCYSGNPANYCQSRRGFFKRLFSR